MPRTHGYGPRGKRVFGIHDWHAKGRTNVIGALLSGALLTCWLCSFNVDSDVFYHWVRHDLIPKLPPGCVLVMDNATFHQRADIKKAIADAGHILEFMPAYSPDLNPIEHKWAQAKAIRRKTGKKVEALFKTQL